ncbi:MAG: phosphoenolpyruvate synthase [Spirochaetia bacterium]|nr:MAG: phosphoenolpyruvate synthase [Spirochaetia bacterium]
MNKKQDFIKQYKEVGIKNVLEVGGKNGSLGEMIQYLKPKGLNVPDGFAITAEAYRYFLKKSVIRNSQSRIINLETFIKKTLAGLNTKNLQDLAKRGKAVRETIKSVELPKELEEEIVINYQNLEKEYGKNSDVAVRTSGTTEDAPDASFAGQYETFLNIRGAKEVLEAVKASFASLFTDRAISYRADKGFDYSKMALSVGVQKMVRSDLGCSGIMFTLDTESGFPDVVLISGAWGLGEMVVQGEVTPDEFLVFKKTGAIIDKRLGDKTRKMIYSTGQGIKKTKVVDTNKEEREKFVLSEAEILKLAKWGMIIEKHYTALRKKWTPMDMEWAKDGKTGELFIVQARPETVHSRRDFSKIKEYELAKSDKMKKIIVKGASVGNKIAIGKARIILDAKQIGQFKAGEVLVTDMTDPDWEPIMKIASAIVTDKGGRTSHAAIVSRELGIPCVVGSGSATRKIKTGQTVTVDTTSSEGVVYDGALKFKVIEHNIKKFPKPKTKIMMNIATSDTAFEKSLLPNDGVGLAREEFIIASDIGIHPMALINYGRLKDLKLKAQIDKKTIGYEDKKQFYVDKLAYGIAKIAAAFYPKQVIVRFSDFKTNEYRTLIGGEIYEPQEENPMIGWRGASRYYHPNFAPAFILELEAIKKVREKMKLDNVAVMVPFCRTVEEGKKVVKIIKSALISQNPHKSALKIYMMCEIPSNVVLADEFLDVFDGMSIGSNDLTQLTVGIDRDASELVRDVANEKDESVKRLISEVIKKCRKRKKYIGICGQAPSDYPDFAEFLVEQGIESMSLNPDTVIKTTLKVYEKEKKLKK